MSGYSDWICFENRLAPVRAWTESLFALKLPFESLSLLNLSHVLARLFSTLTRSAAEISKVKLLSLSVYALKVRRLAK